MKFIVVFLLLQNVFSELDTNWWRSTTIYEVYIWSFKDSNGDGIGDIKGITKMMNHFQDLNIETIYLSPFCKSPMVDKGYDVSNFTEIDHLFGTMKDFDEMMEEMSRRGLKLIMDFVINHSSDKHPWFIKSINRIHPYTDFYIWQNPKSFDNNGKPIPPNNWLSIFEGSAWEWNHKRKQFYYHQFGTYQPDFNLRNIFLKKEIKKILTFWLEKGVAGFRLDATKHYLEDEKLRDEPPIKAKMVQLKRYNDLNHIYTTDLWESYEFIHESIRKVVDEFTQQRGDFERILVAEAYTDEKHLMQYYDTLDYRIVNFPFNFNFVGINVFQNATEFGNTMRFLIENMPKKAVANWVSENHDIHRIGTKLNEEYMDIIIIASMTAPGVACLYYGQEIGMTENKVRDDQRQDLGGADDIIRDVVRLPMQWDDSLNAGFSSKLKTWLPVHPNYWQVNVKAQKNARVSRYKLVQDLSKIRKTKTLKYGSFTSYILSTWVFAFTRTYKKHETYITVINLGSETEILDLHIEIPNLSPVLEVVASSINSGYLRGTKVDFIPKFPSLFAMRPQSSIVLKTVRKNIPSGKNEEFETTD